MKDINGDQILIGMSVSVPTPNDNDLHAYGFIGTVDGFKSGLVQVLDSDGDIFEIESERLEIVED